MPTSTSKSRFVRLPAAHFARRVLGKTGDRQLERSTKLLARGVHGSPALRCQRLHREFSLPLTLALGPVHRIVVPYFVTKPGQQLFVYGSVPALGSWDTTRALPLVWSEGHSHSVEIDLPAGKMVEAKVRRWERGV